nr:MAG TPA: hypothetical protein [Caudoviricetes sp.]
MNASITTGFFLYFTVFFLSFTIFCLQLRRFKVIKSEFNAG